MASRPRIGWCSGIVNLSRIAADSVDANEFNELPRLPIPSRSHQSRRLAVPGERPYLWRAVDQDGDVIDILVQRYRNARAAKRFFRKLLKEQGSKPWQLVTDKLKSYATAQRSLMPSVDHNTGRYANNLAEVSHQPTRQRERQMRGFKSAGQAQRFLSVHGVIRNLFNLGRHQLSSANYRLLRERSFKEWSVVTAA